MANIITAPESGIYFDGNTAGTGVIPVLTGNASGVAIQYDGYAGITISSSATGANYQDRFSIEGENGRLFGVSDQVTGSVFSVNDGAGLPLIDVDVESSFSKITLGQYGTDAIVISGSSVQVTGSNVVTAGYLSDQSYLTSSDETYSTASDLLVAIKTVDGASSNLDADKLDGQEGSYYLDYSNFSSTPTVNDVSETNLLNRLAALDSSDTIYIGDAGDDTTVVVRGTLQVDGSTTTINSNTLSIGDNQIVLNNDVTGTPTQNAGIIVERGTSTNASLIWDEANDYWKAGLAGSEVQLALTNGTYSGLRAQSTTKADVGLSNVTNESKATMFTTPTFTGGGNTATLKKGTGNPALAFAGTSDQASALIEGIAGGGLQIYTSNGGTLSSPSWSTKMTIAAGGNTTFTGTVSAPDLTLTSLSAQNSELTALMINGSNVVGTRELGSAAFSATSAFATAAQGTSAENALPLAGGTLTGDLKISATDPTITLIDSSGANTDPNGTIIFSEVSGTKNFDINYNGASDRLEFRGLISSTLTDLVYIKRSSTDTVEVFGNVTASSFVKSGGSSSEFLKADGSVDSSTYVSSSALSSYLPLAGGTMTGSTLHGDSVKSYWGTDNDLRIQHSGSSGSIYNITGDLNIINDATDSDILFKSDDGSGGIAEYLRLDGGTTTLQAYKDLLIANDTAQLKFGASQDLQIYHDGSNSVLNNTTGNLQIYNNADDGDIQFISDNGAGGVAEYLRLDGSLGYTVASKHILLNDGVKLRVGSSADLEIYHDGSNSYIDDTGTGDLYIRANNLRLSNADGSGQTINTNNGGNVELFFNNSKKLETTSTGVDIAGTINFGNGASTGNLSFGDSNQLQLGTGNDLRIYHNGSHSYVVNNTGDLEIINNTDDGDIKLVSDDGSGGTATYVSIDGGAVQTRFHKNTRHSDGVIALFGSGNDLQIFHDGSNSYIQDTGTGSLITNTDAFLLKSANNGEFMMTAYQDGAVNLFHNNTTRFSTTSTGVDVTGTITASGGGAAPSAPASASATIVGETVEVTFAASTTSNIDAYLVYSSIDGSDYGLISVVPPDDFAASMSIIDNAFDETGTQAYRVYATKLGKLSSATTASVSYAVSSAEPTTMSVINLNNAYYVQWNPPSSNARFVTAYNVYKHEHATQGSLSRSSASLIYSGLNTNYMYQISGTNNNNFHQFWVETTIA